MIRPGLFGNLDDRHDAVGQTYCLSVLSRKWQNFWTSIPIGKTMGVHNTMSCQMGPRLRFDRIPNSPFQLNPFPIPMYWHQ
jgi:hypothetical protein